jgi:hypothetical protein
MISSLRHLKKMNLPFVFTNQHAYPVMAEYYSDLEDLDKIDWEILQKRDFKHDPDDPGKEVIRRRRSHHCGTLGKVFSILLHSF